MAVRDTPVHITIDSRESRSGVPNGFATYKDVTTDVKELDAGDYVVEDSWALSARQRKTLLAR
jgi:ERCC4-type nuclease